MSPRGNAPEVEDTPAPAEGAASAADAKQKPPTRGDVPEGFCTPVQFAKVLTERKLHTAKDGSNEVKPQMVYSYMKNSPNDDKLETQEITDSNGVTRKVFKIEDALAWWERKNARVTERKANAKVKEDKKAAAAAKREADKAAGGDGSGEAVAEAE